MTTVVPEPIPPGKEDEASWADNVDWSKVREHGGQPGNAEGEDLPE